MTLYTVVVLLSQSNPMLHKISDVGAGIRTAKS